MRSLLRVLAAVLYGLMAATPTIAWGPTGVINGQVLDSSQSAMPGVSVTARHAGTGDTRISVTNADGFYTIAALPVGSYEVSYQLEGFKTITRQNVRVEAAVPLTMNVVLEVGGISEQVTVVAEIPVLQTTTAAVARQLSAEELEAVPSSTRNFTHLLTATAGISADLPPVASNDTGSISPSVNGTKTTSNSVLYNGVDITSLLSNSGSLDESLVPAPETIQEVKLQTSLYDASTGRSGGGNFQLVTKSGTNHIAGTAYGFGQHERFNSNDFFFERDGIERPRMRRMESGFTIGGPLRRERAFFFGSFQRSDAETGYVPTASSRALVLGGGMVNEVRAGYFALRNTRRLDDDFLRLTNESFGINNPALLFDDRDATRRLGHYVSRGATWSFGGPNDSFNQREQETFHVADALTWLKGNHNLRFGADFKFHQVATNLPEEQATEFEKFENWHQFLVGLATEADTQFGFTQKHFRSYDASWFVSDDWRVSSRLTLNLGVRWDWYGWPFDKNGYLGNFDPARVTDPDNPLDGFVVPSRVTATGIGQVDNAVAAAAHTSTNHTLAGQDWDNFAPRVGFAYTPSADSRWAVRGGYGLFYDRPSAAFMNTVFSNYPFLREIEITVPTRGVGLTTAFATQTPNGQAVDFNRYFPFRLTFAGGSYVTRDGTAIGGTGNIAETLEFRAIDLNLETPFYQHWNAAYQVQLWKDLGLEVRYSGSRGQDLLLATALNQPWDLNAAGVPGHILDRITAAYRPGGGTANAQDPGALGYGYVNPATGRADQNFGPGGRLIPSEARGFYLGMNDAEAIMLQSRGRSNYHALQTTLTKRMSHGVEFHGAYTYSRSRDLFSSDPGSTAGGGRPDEPNTGFSVENDSRDLEANYARSDFDRPHRFSFSAIWNLPMEANALVRDWQIATFMQFQSGRPFSLYAPESDPLMRLAFQRVDLAPGASLADVRQHGGDEVEAWFNTSAVQKAFGPGSSPRNFLRGPDQKRVDLSIAKALRLGTRVRAELRWEIFTLFNTANLGLPNNTIDSVEFGRITNTVGGPRVSQFGLRVAF